MNIIPLFPTAVGKFIFRDLTDTENSFISNLDMRKNTFNSTSLDFFILRHEELKELKIFFENSVDEYFEKIYCPENSNARLKITQSWTNTTLKTEKHHPHSHSNSFLSGVFYVRSNPDLDKIYFKDKIKAITEQLNPSKPKECHFYNSNVWWLPAEIGTLYIFPSNLEHFVETVETDTPRISIAFNTFPTGEWGLPYSLNYIKF